MGDFAVKNNLRFGKEKCKVMKVGENREIAREWNLGELMIEECQKYKYLGDVITGDGKNKENILSRANKIQAAIRSINTTASSDVMKRIHSTTIVRLYNVVIIPSLLTNAE